MTKRLEELLKIAEIREEGEKRLYHIQELRKKRIEGHRSIQVFKVGSLVLWCRKMAKIKKGKLRMKWEGPFCVDQEWGNGTFSIRSMDGKEQELVNGNKLKPYFMRENVYYKEMEKIMGYDLETEEELEASNNLENLEGVITLEEQEKYSDRQSS